MKVRELIAALAQEDDMESTVHVRIIDKETGDDLFGDVDGIATYSNSYRPTNMITCTTLEICALCK